MKRFLPLAFALVKFVSGYFLISPAYELHRDEYLYLNQGQHLGPCGCGWPACWPCC